VALLVNNLGSTSDLEMNIVALEAIKLLGNKDAFIFTFSKDCFTRHLSVC